MKNKKFFYLQYNKINWKNQEKTKINQYINNYIIDNILSKNNSKNLSIYDIGFGIGFFFKMVSQKLKGKYEKVILEGCEPSKDNYSHFSNSIFQKSNKLKVQQIDFLNSKAEAKFDFVTAIYVFPHFVSNDLGKVTKKIRSLLKPRGKFILAVANEDYIKNKLKDEKDLFIETNEISFDKKKYKETLHYSDIPKIGKLIDYNREEIFYENLFRKNKFKPYQKHKIDDNGFIATLFVFEKN